MRPLLLAVMIICALPWASHARAEPEVTVTLQASPAEVAVGDTLQLEVRVRVRGGGIESLRLADLKRYPELDIVSRQTVRPMQFSFGFGKGVQMESSLAEIYLLRATAPGTFEFKPAVAEVDGRTYRSAPLTIVVRESAGDAGSSGDPSEPLAAPADDDLSGAHWDPRAFLRTVTEPKEVYVGQQVDVTVYLYTRVRLSPHSVIPSKPPMDGFWVYDDQITSLQSTTIAVRGHSYRAYLLQRSAAFPQRSGELTIGPPKVAFDAGGASLFDVPERIEREGLPVTVLVKPLPQPGPANAVVGSYELRASLDRTDVRTGDAVTLRAEATGRGNVQDLRIDLPPIAGVRALRPSIRDEQRFAGGVVTGTRTWEWILIAEMPGKHTIPPIELHFFDPEAERYGSSATVELAFESAGAAKPAPSIEPVEAPKPKAATFGPIRMYSALTRNTPPVRERSWFAWVLGLPPISFVLVVSGALVARRREQKRQTAGSVQRQLLRSAQAALRRNDPRSFYDRIVESITHALDSMLGESVSAMPHADLRKRLLVEGFDDDLVSRVINELEGADFARFAASGVSNEEMQRCLSRTVAILERMGRSRRAS